MSGERHIDSTFEGNLHVTKSLRNCLLNGSDKPENNPSSTTEHLLNNPECEKHYEDKKFYIFVTGQNAY